MAAPPPRQRRSARVILLDEKGRTLLIRFSVVRRGVDVHFWATPGGGVEAGEEPLKAARREAAEELGVQLDLVGPVHESRDRFEHEGEIVDGVDVFFLGRSASSAPKLRWAAEAERKAMRELRWWSADEIDASDETIFPPCLGQLVRRLAADPRP
jgi:8-oxo-dGTP pyrophosphatase MutT (NUDIX family)